MTNDWRDMFPVGCRVLIIGNHAHKGKSGVVEEHEDGAFFGKRLVVRCDDGLSAGILNPDNLMRIR